ncbi:MAG: hypothetical protein GX102_06255 [Porphyromonadaceae bacterium]|nr:hypothetical protein [Porphyromonadaceae bacterium]
MKKIYLLLFKILLLLLFVFSSNALNALGTNEWNAGKYNYTYKEFPQKKNYSYSIVLFDNSLPFVNARIAPSSSGTFHAKTYASKFSIFRPFSSNTAVPIASYEFSNGEWRSTTDRMFSNSFRLFSRSSDAFNDYRSTDVYETNAAFSLGNGIPGMQRAPNEDDPEFPGDPGQFYQPVGGGLWIMLLLVLTYFIYQRKNSIFNLIRKFYV